MKVSSISSFTTDTESIDNTYYRILQYLQGHGYKCTGVKAIDMLTFYESQIDDVDEVDESDSEDTSYVPWAEFMLDLGLTVTGDLDEDKQTTINELKSIIYGLTDEDELAYYQNLLEEVDYEFVEDQSVFGSPDFNISMQTISDINKALITTAR